VRYIDPRRVEDRLNGNWISAAAELRRQLDEAPDSTIQKEIIKDNADTWRDLKPILRLIAERKCWYCETNEDRSDNAVDHYRPKSFYWWLAFAWTNLRYSCTYCNSRRKDPDSEQVGGKQDLFPLAPGNVRATTPGQVRSEEPLLLDPCIYDDHRLIWFDETGLTKVHPTYKDDVEVIARVEASVDLYNLDFGQLAAHRRRKFREVNDLCEEGDELWVKYESSKDETFLKGFSRVVVKLVRLIDDREPHSAAALHATLGRRTASATARRALSLD